MRGLDFATGRAELHGWKRSYSTGNEGIIKDRGEWLVKSHRSTVGFTASLAYVDEAFAVKLTFVQQNLAPTTVEAASGQLLLASTAHPACTDLVPTYRAEAIDDLAAGDGTLLHGMVRAPPCRADVDGGVAGGVAALDATAGTDHRRSRQTGRPVRRRRPR